MIIVKVKLSKDKSFEMRKLLSANNFIICLVNSVTNDIVVLDENYDVENIIYMDECLSFVCIYNGMTLPSQEVFKAFTEDESVRSYIIQKKE
ncbi:hypothetical protein IKF32_03410 [Candidatus Saccharibacteria bacterium]|nr:hypothetical protein [Candidatus Saccharibacteria bacterium]